MIFSKYLLWYAVWEPKGEQTLGCSLCNSTLRLRCFNSSVLHGGRLCWMSLISGVHQQEPSTNKCPSLVEVSWLIFVIKAFRHWKIPNAFWITRTLNLVSLRFLVGSTFYCISVFWKLGLEVYYGGIPVEPEVWLICTSLSLAIPDNRVF